jgi:DNA-3-methyladenine glycosylase
MSKKFSRDELRNDTVKVAKRLLGGYLYRRINGNVLAGRIVETEAYKQGDPACHAFRGPTKRTEVMFGDAGFSYIYFTYGMHHCFNVVTNKEGVGEAVLIRALEPIEGVEEMFARREKAVKETDLLSGPGKFCQAFDLSTKQSGIDLLESHELYLVKAAPKKSERIGVSTRVGLTVAVDKKWRFYLEGNPFVSRGKPSGG